MPEEAPEDGRSWLESRLKTLDALYRRYGRDGLKDQPVSDVNLLLSAKELEFRDMPKGREQTEQQKADNRRLELEIRDLTGFVNAQFVGLHMQPRGQKYFQPSQQQQQYKGKQRGRDFEMG